MIPTVEQVQEREGEYYVVNTRVPVGVVIAAWQRATTPQHIVEQFPSLSLADVYGVITYYLDHQQELDAHFARLQDRTERPEYYADLRQRIDAWRVGHAKPENGRDDRAETSPE
jgi:uncharacterized protein (DUF433 family)